MKNLAIFFVLSFLSFSINLSAETKASSPESNYCVWKSWFKYPQNNATYDYGKNIFVRVDPQKYRDIKEISLFINGRFIRTEYNFPFEWAKSGSSSDNILRSLKPGTYRLKAKIKTKCGRYYEIFCKFYVRGKGGQNPGNTLCEYKAWFKYPQNGKYFNPGSSVYVKLDAQNYHRIKYVELFLNGKPIRKEMTFPYEWARPNGNGDHYLRNLKPGTYKLKARVYDKCGKYKDYYCTFYVKGGGNPGGGNNMCKYKSWFKYPKNNGTYRYGDDVFVRVDTEKFQDIKEMHLFVNGKLVRVEYQYPFEWAKPNGNGDNYLRNLKRGTYNLKVRVKTKCGKWFEYFCKFYVR